jgi:hypothetical protein
MRILAFISLVVYFIPLAALPFHCWEETQLDCQACTEPSSGVNIGPACSPENPCDSPAHHHHNHPIHQHNCSLCGHITKYGTGIVTGRNPDSQTISHRDINVSTGYHSVDTLANTPIRAPPAFIA